MEHTTLPVTRIAIAVAVILAVLFVPRWLRSRGRGREEAAHASGVLRENILTRQFIAQFPPGKPGAPRCVLMDWNVGGSVATLVAFDDGTVSLYLSSGGGIIGAGAHANVARAAAPFREQAHAILSKLSPATTFPLPAGESYEMGFDIAALPLLPGSYQLEVYVKDLANYKFELVPQTYPFEVVEADTELGRYLDAEAALQYGLVDEIWRK